MVLCHRISFLVCKTALLTKGGAPVLKHVGIVFLTTWDQQCDKHGSSGPDKCASSTPTTSEGSSPVNPEGSSPNNLGSSSPDKCGTKVLTKMEAAVLTTVEQQSWHVLFEIRNSLKEGAAA